VELPFDQADMDPEEFWGSLLEVTNGANSPHASQFQTLDKFMCNFTEYIASLPHANVDVERIFSSVNHIKT
jgi:hypothetical protein